MVNEQAQEWCWPLDSSTATAFAPSSPSARSMGVVSDDIDTASILASEEGRQDDPAVLAVANKKQKLASSNSPSACMEAPTSHQEQPAPVLKHKTSFHHTGISNIKNHKHTTASEFSSNDISQSHPPQQNKIKKSETPALAKLLRAVSASQALEASTNSTGGPKQQVSAEDILARRRERNRALAKEARARKKNQIESVTAQLKCLIKENSNLQSIINKHIAGPKHKKDTLIQAQQALLKVPDIVWEAIGLPNPREISQLGDHNSNSTNTMKETKSDDRVCNSFGCSMLEDLAAPQPKLQRALESDQTAENNALSVVEEDLLLSTAVTIPQEATAVFEESASSDPFVLPISGGIPNPLSATLTLQTRSPASFEKNPSSSWPLFEQ